MYASVQEMVKANRRPSSRAGFVLKAGFLVRHVESHLLRIVEIIQEDYEEDGYTIITEPVNSSGAEVRKLLGGEVDAPAQLQPLQLPQAHNVLKAPGQLALDAPGERGVVSFVLLSSS